MALMNKIGVLIESHFDETEFTKFNQVLPQNGFQIDYLSYLWGQSSLTFVGNDNTQTVGVSKCISQTNPKDYDAIILIGGYAMDRLRYQEQITRGAPNTSPAVQFLRKTITVKDITIGTICHSLWLYCAAPDLLKGKRVTCSHNILWDVLNAGGDVQFAGNGTVDTFIDGNLVSAKHPAVVDKFITVLLSEVRRKRAPQLAMV